ncbi:hypothetical protein [Paraglaciecola marina]|uniref:hypothetical protein n=1 Tax=Paraglaciecola marina TaxID=2500157 RepID=UPI00105E34FE|nr:hypothetical protein [Paraglaciecola marina]
MLNKLALRKKAFSAMKSPKTLLAGSLLAASGSAMADLAEVEAAIIAKIGEAETFGYAILAVGLVASIGIILVRSWAKKGIS